MEHRSAVDEEAALLQKARRQYVEAGQEPAHQSCREKGHGKQEDADAVEDRGEGPVLRCAGPDPEHADEPEKGVPGLRHQEQRQFQPILVGFEPAGTGDPEAG